MKFCLIGEKLGHSYSKDIHNLKGIDYSLVEIEKSELEKFVKSNNFSGFNVTIPYKKDVIKYLDFTSLEATGVGAVNVVVKKDGKSYGYNTDVAGIEYTFIKNHVEIKDKNVLILGTGGASKAVEYVCKNQGAKSINFVSRTGSINYENCYQLTDTNVLINATPVGTYPNFLSSPIDLFKFKNLTFVFDLIYNPQKTALLIQAESLKIPCSNGLTMLVKQAVKAQELWGFEKVSDKETDRIISIISKSKLNLYLTGMPGSGKTTVAKLLSKYLNKQVIDLDLEIEKSENLSPKDIINTYGEAKFREIETSVFEKVCKNSNVIVSLGGGTFIKDVNRSLIKSTGISVYINRPLELLSTVDRPLSQKLGVEKLLQERSSIYKTADFEVLNDNKVENCVKEIISFYENFSY